MADITFTDFSVQVINAMNDAVNAALEECAGELEAEVKRNTRVDTGQTKNSWKHKTDTGEHKAVVGSDHENAIWEEFGTGEYALKGNGRQGGWAYQDAHGNWHKTTGKKPNRALHNAFISKKGKVKQRLQNAVKGL
jgi:HK97 gp10 family phage protein